MDAISRYAIRNLFRRKTRTAFAVAGIAIGISAVMALSAVSGGLLDALQSALNEFPGDVFVFRPSSGLMEQSQIDEKWIGEVAKLDDVEWVEPYIFRMHAFPVSSLAFQNETVALDPTCLELAGRLPASLRQQLLIAADSATAKWQGEMSTAERDALMAASTHPAWQQAVLQMFATARKSSQQLAMFPVFGVKPGGKLASSFPIVPGSGPGFSGRGKEVLLGFAVAERLRKEGGGGILPKIIPINPWDVWTVVGVYRTNGLRDNGFVLAYDTAQSIVNLKNQCSILLAGLKPSGDVLAGASTSERTARLISRIDALGPTELKGYRSDELISRFGGDISRLRQLVFGIGFIAALAGAVGVLNTMMSNVYERTREIGLLLAVGWHRRQVVRAVLTEGFVVSLLGGVLAVPLALMHVEITRVLIQLDPVPKGINTSVYTFGIGLSIALGLAGSLLPAVRASRLSPIEALREL